MTAQVRPVASWEVHYLWIPQMRPAAKFKFVIALHVEPEHFYGFVINSQVNTYYHDRPYLLPCHVPITQTEHPFLDRDSFVDCTQAFTVMVSETSSKTFAGEIELSARSAILNGADACQLLRAGMKKLILSLR